MHFEITADDPKRASQFYAKAFGWTFQAMPGPQTYLLTTTGPKDQPGIDGGIMPRNPQLLGAQSVVNTIDVDDLESSVTAIEGAGGKVLQPKQAVPGIGWFTYCRDTEGNVFGIFKTDPAAR